MLSFRDSPNPVTARGGHAAAPGLPVPMARLGTLVVLCSDGVTGTLARADLSTILPGMDPAARAELQELFEEAVEAALQVRGGSPTRATLRAAAGEAAHAVPSCGAAIAAAIARFDGSVPGVSCSDPQSIGRDRGIAGRASPAHRP